MIAVGTVMAQAKPPPAVASRKIPAAVQAGLPKGAASNSGARVGSHFLHWYHHAGDASEAWHLAIWSRARDGVWRFLRRVRLPAGSAPVGNGDDFAPHVTTYWLRPNDHSGPILEVAAPLGDYHTSFYVFPRGFDGPVWVWSGRGGSGAHNRSRYWLGPPDQRGFRVLQGEYRWGTVDANDNLVDEVTEWKRYWTGKGWGKKGREHTLLRR